MASQKTMYKVLIIGPWKSGKTSVLERYFYDRAPRDHVTTMGADIFPKKVVRADKVIEINFWDLASQDRRPILGEMMVRRSNSVIIIFDLNNPDSFAEAASWKKDLDAKIDDCPVYLMGNKLDLINSSTHQAMNKKMKEFTLKNSKNNAIVDYFCVSAVNKENLDSSFQTVIDNLLNSGCGSSDSKRGLIEPEKESQNSKPSCGC